MMFNKKKFLPSLMRACLSLVILALMATTPLLAADTLRINGKSKPVTKLHEFPLKSLKKLAELAKDQRVGNLTMSKQHQTQLSNTAKTQELEQHYKTDRATIAFVKRNPQEIQKAMKKAKSAQKKKRAAAMAAGGVAIAGATSLGTALAMDGGDGGDTGDGTVGGEGFYPGDGGGATTLPGEVVDPGFSRPAGPQPR